MKYDLSTSKCLPISHRPRAVILAGRGWGVADNCTPRKSSHVPNDEIMSKRVKAALSLLSLADTSCAWANGPAVSSGHEDITMNYNVRHITSMKFSTHCKVWMLDFVRFFEKFIGTEMAVLPAVPLIVEKLWLHPSFCSVEVQWCVIEFFETGFDCNSWWPNTANELAFRVKFVRLTERIESWSIQECCIWWDSSKLPLCYRLPHSLLRNS